MADNPYSNVRALERGLALLAELNRVGHARAAILAQATGIDRTTTYRLLATLERLGLVDRRAADDMFVLTSKVRTLSDGYHERDHLTRCVSLHLGALLQQVLWPSDFAIFDRDAMVIGESTHRFSPYSIHRAMIGRTRPLFSSALGRAFLAGASEAQRRTVIEIARGRGAEHFGMADARQIDASLARLTDDFAERGYAWSVGGTETHISAIALPVRIAGDARGAINLVFFRSAMAPDEAAKRYLEPLRACIARIEREAQGDAFA